MIDNSVTIFYEGEGKIWTQSRMTDMTKKVSENTYSNANGACGPNNRHCLDDPYEGEMMAVMMTLFAPF